jgi:hypothetical protein
MGLGMIWLRMEIWNVIVAPRGSLDSAARVAQWQRDVIAEGKHRIEEFTWRRVLTGFFFLPFLSYLLHQAGYWCHVLRHLWLVVHMCVSGTSRVVFHGFREGSTVCKGVQAFLYYYDEHRSLCTLARTQALTIYCS